MSIWATYATIGEDDEGDKTGSVRDYRDGQSNQFPTNTEPSGVIYVDLVPWWCVPGWDGSDDAPAEGAVGRVIRMSTHRDDGKSASVYLHEAAVLSLYHRLGEWLMIPKVEVDGKVVPPPTPTEMQPTRLWRALAPDGTVWAESSSRFEVEKRMRSGDTLYQLWAAPAVTEWRATTAEWFPHG